MLKRSRFILFGLFFVLNAHSQPGYTLSGKVLDVRTKLPVEFATVALNDEKLWAITNEKGEFILTDILKSRVNLHVTSFGYVEVELELDIRESLPGIEILLSEKNLALDEVVVTAQRKISNLTTSYLLDRTTLDHAQLLTISNITNLLPGGKTRGIQSLISSTNILLQAQTSEQGNATFGTAIEIDGIRLSNNSNFQSDGSSTVGLDIRNISSVNIESVEITTGIPSVEYGDLSNGMVNVKTRKGKTPYIVEMSTKPHTKQVALSKGFSLGKKAGMLNTSFDHTKSISKIHSPYTAYDRNNLSLRYSKAFNEEKGNPILFSLGLDGNVGGYDSQADPDHYLDAYTKQKDNTIRANFSIRYLLNKPWITNFQLSGSYVKSNKQSEKKEYKDAASSTAALHTQEEGYFIGSLYKDDPNTPIILIPAGKWTQISYFDTQPVDYNLKFKADWVRKFGNIQNNILLGADFQRSGNFGKGRYYDDYSLAPTWRAYRLDEVPFMNNWGLYAEEKISHSLTERSDFELMAGIRSDITHIAQSEYGIAGNLSPRFNLKYNLNNSTNDFLRALSVYVGWGKFVKLPSFEVLYPAPAYSDILAFTPGSTEEALSYPAYYTRTYQPIYNPDLKWQYLIQQEIGIQVNLKGTRISISAFRKKTYNPYMSVYDYIPFSYKFTSQKALEFYPVGEKNRQYLIDRQTGIVSVVDKTGQYPTQELPYSEKKVFKSQSMYTNGTPVERRGLEWIVDFAPIQSVNTSFRIDGNYYYYKGLNETPYPFLSSSNTGDPYQYIGYYIGYDASSTYSSANASYVNGKLSKQLNTNLTITTHIPKVRMIVSMKIESSLYRYEQRLCEYSDGRPRGYLLENQSDFFSTDTDIYGKNKYIIVYPEYYSTWENPDELIPFLDKFKWAYENDKTLYNELTRMVQKSNYGYIFNPSRISAYFSANINITKEIGNIASISFYANNFLNSLAEINNTWNNSTSSLYESGYIPPFYYGLSLRLKL